MRHLSKDSSFAVVDGERVMVTIRRMEAWKHLVLGSGLEESWDVDWKTEKIEVDIGSSIVETMSNLGVLGGPSNL